MESMIEAATNRDYVSVHELNKSLGVDSVRSTDDRQLYHCRHTILQSGIDSDRRDELIADAQGRLRDLL